MQVVTMFVTKALIIHKLNENVHNFELLEGFEKMFAICILQISI